MDMGSLIETHECWVLVVGCLLEGETVLVLAGIAVHLGYLNPFAVVAIAATAGFTGDQFYSWLGRCHGNALLEQWPSVAAQNVRLQRLISRYHAALIIGIRFVYGLRIAGPVLIGMSPIPGARFAMLNALGAILWAFLIAGVGWVFGQAAQTLMGDISHFEFWLLIGIAAVGVFAWWLRRSRSH
jgi:membrane protein DedA with SNARE-associated domain